jgi:hypothetical protein
MKNNGVDPKNLLNINPERNITKPKVIALRYLAIINGSAPVTSLNNAKTAGNKGGSAMINVPASPPYLTKFAISLATEKYKVVSGETPIPFFVVAKNNVQVPRTPSIKDINQ